MGVYLPRLILKITTKVPTMSRVMMVSRTPMTSPTYSGCDCSSTVCTLDWVVSRLAGWMELVASVTGPAGLMEGFASLGIGEAVLISAGGEGEGFVLKGFSSNNSEK